MGSSLIPNPSDTTNALLKIMVNKLDNGTFSAQDASLPVWKGPSSTDIWIQAIAYTSLSTSLLAAFGAVLCKQWLGYFKTSRFGQGTVEQRCMQRQRKLDGLETWKFGTIIDTLPMLLQFSLLFFGIALSANIWIQQHTVASVIIGTTVLGVLFYFFTIVASLSSPDCPFQTPVSTVLECVQKGIVPTSRWAFWAGLPSGLRSLSQGTFRGRWHMIYKSVSRFLAYVWRMTQKVPLPSSGDPESAIGSEKSKPSEVLDLMVLDYHTPVEPLEARAVQWILDTSTDTDTIAAVVRMVPGIEWLDQHDIPSILERLNNHFLACFDSARQLRTFTQAPAVACLKALFHLWIVRGLEHSTLNIYSHSIRFNGYIYYIEIEDTDRALLYSVQGQGRSSDLNFTFLSSSDRMWIAHLFTHQVYKGDKGPEFDGFVTSFIDVCLDDSHNSRSPSRLVADCLLLMGLMIGQKIDRRHLRRLDKRYAQLYYSMCDCLTIRSPAIQKLQDSVIKRLLDIFSNESSVEERHILNAKKLLQPLYHHLERDPYYDHGISIRCLKLGFHFLGQKGVSGNKAATVLHLSVLCSPVNPWYFSHHEYGPDRWHWLGPPDWHTPSQFGLLVDHLIQVCEKKDYDAIYDAFVVLAGLRGSPSTLERKRTYIERMIQFMELDTPLNVCEAALNAACVVRTDVASLGRDDALFRYHFSQALTSVLRDGDAPHRASSQGHTTPLRDGPWVFSGRERYSRYLQLLCALVRQPAWRGQLQQSGHFDNCLEIANTLLSLDTQISASLGACAVYVTHIFAIIDSLGREQTFPKEAQACLSWRLIWKAWHHIFRFSFFEMGTKDNWKHISSTGYLEALPSLAAYTTKYREQWDKTEETRILIQLVTQVCHKLDEETHRSEKAVALSGQEQNASFGHRGIPDLYEQIRKLLSISKADM